MNFLVTAAQVNKYAFILDIVVLVALFVVAVIGAKKGGVKTILGFLSTAVAVLIAWLLLDRVVGWINSVTGVEKWLAGGLETAFLKLKNFDFPLSEDGIRQTSFPAFIQDMLIKELGATEYPAGTTVATIAGEFVATWLVKIVVALALFGIARLLLWLVCSIFSGIIEKISFLSALNRIGGAIIWLAEGLVIICAVLALVSLLPLPYVADFCNSTLLIKFLYNDNPLLKLVLA